MNAKWQTLDSESWFARRRGDFPNAESLLLQAVEVASADPEDRSELCLSLNVLANLYADRGRLDDALALAERAVVVRRGMPQSRSGFLGADLMLVAQLLARCDRAADSIGAAEEGVSLYSQSMGPTHNETVRMSEVLADLRRTDIDPYRPMVAAPDSSTLIDATPH